MYCFPKRIEKFPLDPHLYTVYMCTSFLLVHCFEKLWVFSLHSIISLSAIICKIWILNGSFLELHCTVTINDKWRMRHSRRRNLVLVLNTLSTNMLKKPNGIISVKYTVHDISQFPRSSGAKLCHSRHHFCSVVLFCAFVHGWYTPQLNTITLYRILFFERLTHWELNDNCIFLVRYVVCI